MIYTKNLEKEVEKKKQLIYLAGQKGKDPLSGKMEKHLQKDYVMNVLERETMIQQLAVIILPLEKTEIEDMNKRK